MLATDRAQSGQVGLCEGLVLADQRVRKRDVFNGLFNVPRDDKLPCIFVEPGVIEQLQALAEEPKSH